MSTAGRTATPRGQRVRALEVVLVLVVGVLAAAVAPAAAPAAAASGAVVDPGYDWSVLDAELEAATDGCTVTCGLVLHLQRRWADDGPGPHQTVLLDAWGSFTTETEVWTASAGKLITGITVSTVIDDGLLSLDTTIGDVFPAYVGTQKGTITVRQLLSHTSGWTAPASCLSDDTTTMAACVDSILALPLAYPPGTRFAYAGPPMQVAARMVEVVTGKPWVQVFAENVATPLGLPTMHWGSSANPRVDGGTPPTGLRATPADYERVLEMLLDGGTYRGSTVLTPTSFHELVTDQTVGTIKQVVPNKTAAGYGLGTWVQRKDGAGATTMITSAGAFGSVPWVDLAGGYAGWWQTQGDSRKIEVLWAEMLPIIEGEMAARPAASRPVAGPPAVTSLSVAAGPAAGGQTMVVTGSGLTGATAVRFGLMGPAAAFHVDTPTQITVVTPARTAGLANVLVTTPLGTSAVGPQTLYRFADRPVVTAVAPAAGPALGGTIVTLTGSGVGGATGVRFGPSTWATSWTVWSATIMTVVVPARAAGVVNIVVQTPGGLSATSPATLFTYQSTSP